LLPPSKSGLTSVVERLAARAGAVHRAELVEDVVRTDGVCLEPIAQTKEAHFQSWTTGFEYQEVQRLNNRETTVALGPNGQELPRGDMNGALKRANSPTTSDSSKENIDEEDNNNLSGMTRYPCPVCKKAFSKVGNVYKHLSTHHNKTKAEYLKMSKAIRNNAFIQEKPETELEELPPKLQFTKAKQTEDAMQLALAVGLVNRNGVGMQKVNGCVGRPAKPKTPLDFSLDARRTGEFQCGECGYISVSSKGLSIHGGLGKCKRIAKETGWVPGEHREAKESLPLRTEEVEESEDGEVTFNNDKEAADSDSEGPDRKRKRVELTKVDKSNNSDIAWNDGQFACQLCDKTFRTATFLLQHYVTPHFKSELKAEFADILPTKKCPTCTASFDSDAKLMMHLGATHREVNKYLPQGVSAPAPGLAKSPLKRPSTSSTVENPIQKFLATALRAQNGSPVAKPAVLNGLSFDEKKKESEGESEAPPARRSPGRPPGSPNKVKKDPASPPVKSPPAKVPKEGSSEFGCVCGFSSHCERGLNIHRSTCTKLSTGTATVKSPPAKVPKESSSDFICVCGFVSISERGLNIHRSGCAKCGNSSNPTNMEFKCHCGFTTLSERGLNIHKSGAKCSSSPKPSPATKSALSPKSRTAVPEIEDEFMT